ncbi:MULTISPECIES: S8 family serine peptidase [Catenuloplanes]|uniref:Subtilisin family serine protease n=1 Tax=Catenuloplanes niger TaxID=587534 RepID=A0AAE3ZZT4_9ACTN|nr:S8 family serine peptidase [Catenuloplanes niger]MDR7326978.1 subtilisin family serine protease [Catenuloplanes niger]
MFDRPHLLRAAAATAVAAASLLVSVVGAQPAQAAAKEDKIPPALAQQFAAKAEADYWIRFTAKADLGKAAATKDWNARGTAVAAELKKTANAAQEKVRAELTSAGVSFQSFWATNAIKVTGGSTTTAQKIAALPEVQGLYPSVAYEIPETKEGDDEKTVNALEWGIASINADDVWSQYGVTGENVVIANIDTGVQFDHPALVGKYRGNNGDGTFDHNYNFFDAANACAGDAPCDTDGHGTHTMGTMAGADGGNQVGVAPGVKWIAANGCCPSDAALITSGQWMLEPTDSAGQNPDASKRPNIINNSWGTRLPSNEPFMEDITNAWTASGIFGVWSNGNIGLSGCNTSGSPGSLVSNYSAGAYDVNNAIANFSSRGAGQNGEVKPNISAPGVNVRSSVPGNGYESISGTSMAAPHLAGAIALLWSAAPALVGDIAGTRALLDGSAIDVNNTSCGGTATDNNVWGEGRLDALALLNSAPIGDTGTLAGTVTGPGGTPVAGATVTVAGAVERTLTTAADGTFSVLLPAGDYTVTIAGFGFGTVTRTVTISNNATTTLDVALAEVPKVKVTGTITDGSGHGWPLYAKITVAGPSGVSDYTDPTDGYYELELPAGATYQLTVDPVYPGYQTVSENVTVGVSDATWDKAVPVDVAACTTAPGYGWVSDGEYETFDAASTPAGWTVTDAAGRGQTWKFTDDGNRGNKTGGTGGFAIVDSDEYGAGGAQDTSLVSPVVNLSAVTAPVIRFNQDFNWLGSDRADVDLSVDGGATWTNVLRQTTDALGPRTTEIPIPTAAGEPDVQVRFRYYDASYEWWWAVDNVLIGTNFECKPVTAGLVVGHVEDKNTGGYVNGATVSGGGTSAVTAATPDDPGLEDGFFWLVSTATGKIDYTAAAANYASQTKSVTVKANRVVATSFQLAAGQITVTPAAVTGTVRMPDGTVSKKITVKNNGGLPVELEFSERPGGFELLRADGTKVTDRQLLAAAGAPLQRLTTPASFASRSSMAATAVPAATAPSAAPWTGIGNYPANVMDNRVVSLDGRTYSIAGGNGTASSAKNYVYDAVAQAWSGIADLPEARNAVTAGAIDGKIYVTGGWGPAGPSPTTWSYDPDANTWTKLADNPAPRAAAAQAVLDGKLYAIGGCTTAACTPMSNTVTAYDPGTNTWSTAAAYPKSVAFGSCGAIADAIYCTGGNDGSASQKASYTFDGTAWTAIADAPADNWASSYAVANGKLLVVGGSQGGAITNAGFAYDPDAGTWSALPNANAARYRGGAACGFYKVGGSSGNFNALPDSEVLPGFEECATGADVSWLTLDKTTATLAPGKSVTVTATLAGTVEQPGTYTAGIAIKENTPYTVAPVSVTLTVQPPKTWGKLLGTVTGINCQGVSAPLAGATVQVDSWAQSFTFTTDAAGRYAHWLDNRNNPLTLIVAKDGWKPQTKTTKINTSTPTTVDWALRPTTC